MGTLSADLDEMSSEAAMSEEKAQRAMIDAARYSCHRPIRLFRFVLIDPFQGLLTSSALSRIAPKDLSASASCWRRR